MGNTNAARILALTDDSNRTQYEETRLEPSDLVHKLMKESASDPSFSQKLDIIERYARRGMILEKASPDDDRHVTWNSEAVWTGRPETRLRIDVRTSALNDTSVSNQSLQQILDHKINREFKNYGNFYSYDDSAHLKFRTFSDLENNLKDTIAAARLSGTELTSSDQSILRPAQSIYSSVKTYHDAFPQQDIDAVLQRAQSSSEGKKAIESAARSALGEENYIAARRLYKSEVEIPSSDTTAISSAISAPSPSGP